MTYTLPDALMTDDDSAALGHLRRYYGSDGSRRYTGAYFDGWGHQAPDRITADDIIAVSFLSVVVPPMAAHRLLVTDVERFTGLVQAIGEDRDLARENAEIDDRWPPRQLYRALRRLPGVGPTIASKLCARKRPKLVPVYDTVVARVTSSQQRQWEPLRQHLRADDGALHRRLLRLREEAELGGEVTALRVYDVITWMEGTESRRLGPTTDEEVFGSNVAELTEADTGTDPEA